MSHSEEHKIIIRPKRGLEFINLSEVYKYKYLLLLLVHKEISILYKQTILGFSWAIIRPLFSMVVFTIVFGNLAKVPSDGIPYPLFSYVALVPWTYFSAAMGKSSLSLVNSVGIFTKVYFPRIIIPLTSVIAGLIDFLIAFSIIIILMIWYKVPPSLNILIIPYLMLIMVLFSSSVGMIFSTLAIQYRDIRHGIQFVSQLLMYATPVVWPISLISEKFGDNFTFVYSFYPMAGVIEGFRSALIGVNPIPWFMILNGSITTIVFFIIGAIFFKNKENIFADVA